MKSFNVKPILLTLSLAALVGCSLLLNKKPDTAQLCQNSFWQSASKSDVAAIDNPNHSCPKTKIIHLATQYALPEVLQELLKRDNVDVNARNKEGYTALILAARFGRERIVQRTARSRSGCG